MYLLPQEMQIFEISDEMRCFGGKRREKLWIAWKWPFQMNLSLIMGEKAAKWPELAILSQSNPLFRLNLALWVISIWYITCLGFIEN